MKRWILLHLFPDLAGYLRMVAQYDEPSSERKLMTDPVTPEEARKDAAGLRAGGDPWPAEIIDSLAAQLEAALERERKLWDEYRKHAIEWDEQGWKTQKVIDILEAEVEHGRDAFEAQLEAAQKRERVLRDNLGAAPHPNLVNHPVYTVWYESSRDALAQDTQTHGGSDA